MTCEATFQDQICQDPAQVLQWCRYHWRQQFEGRPFTVHVQRRARGSSAIREQGRKFCTGCETWKEEAAFMRHAKTFDGLQAWCRDCGRDHRSVGRYGLTRQAVLELVRRQGGCAVCRTTHVSDNARAGWHVDHDHSCCPGEKTCGQCVRAILCARCNLMIGLATDDWRLLEAAAAYLREQA